MALDKIQRRFLKYLSFGMDGIYTLRGVGQKDLHNMQSLETRRELRCAKFAYDLLQSKIDCSDLLSKLPFYAP